MEKERFIERILETENLTDELEDSDANWLLEWGTGQLDRVLQGATDEDTAGGKVNALMAVMRKINRILGSRERKAPQDLVADLEALTGLHAAAFGEARQPTPADYTAAAIELPKFPSRQALELLARWGDQPVAGDQ
jgi:hypothetical protein